MSSYEPVEQSIISSLELEGSALIIQWVDSVIGAEVASALNTLESNHRAGFNYDPNFCSMHVFLDADVQAALLNLNRIELRASRGARVLSWQDTLGAAEAFDVNESLLRIQPPAEMQVDVHARDFGIG